RHVSLSSRSSTPTARLCRCVRNCLGSLSRTRATPFRISFLSTDEEFVSSKESVQETQAAAPNGGRSSLLRAYPRCLHHRSGAGFDYADVERRSRRGVASHGAAPQRLLFGETAAGCDSRRATSTLHRC